MPSVPPVLSGTGGNGQPPSGDGDGNGQPPSGDGDGDGQPPGGNGHPRTGPSGPLPTGTQITNINGILTIGNGNGNQTIEQEYSGNM